MTLAAALELADSELVSFVGAGGKKTAMANLVAAAGERDLRAGYTTTTHMPPPELPLVVARESLATKLSEAPSPVAFARERVSNPDRAERKVRGYDAETLDALFDRGVFDWLLVKADGARRREFKAPGPDEPVVPEASTHVVPVASVRAVGEALDERTVHRPERVAALVDADVGETLTADHVGAVLASERGGCKGVAADATVTPLVNKADTPSLRETARTVLEAALNRTEQFDRGIVCSFETGTVRTVE